MKDFSPEFQHDIADLIDMCVEHQTDSLTITLPYSKHDLKIEMTFSAYPHREDIENGVEVTREKTIPNYLHNRDKRNNGICKRSH